MRVDLVGFNGNATREQSKVIIAVNQAKVKGQSFHEILQECLIEQEDVAHTKERNSIATKMLAASYMPRLSK